MFVNVTKCPAKSKRKPPVCNSRVSVCIRVIFRLGLGLLFMSQSSTIIVRRTLYDVYCQYFSPGAMVKFTRKATGHFVTLTESGMHLIACISGHTWKIWFIK